MEIVNMAVGWVWLSIWRISERTWVWRQIGYGSGCRSDADKDMDIDTHVLRRKADRLSPCLLLSQRSRTATSCCVTRCRRTAC